MSRPPKDERRTMPPLPAAGVRPLAHHDPAHEERSRQEAPKASPQAGVGSPPPAGAGGSETGPKSNPINMALLELQEELELPTSPAVLPTPPAAAVPTPPEPPQTQPQPASPPPPPRQAQPIEAATPVQPEPVAAATTTAPTTPPPTEPSPAATAATALSSTPPIAGTIPRPAERSPQPIPTAPAPAEQGRPQTSILVGGAVVCFLFGMLVAWASSHLFAKPSPAPEVAVAPPTPASEAPAAPAPSAADLDPIKTRLGELGEQIDEFEKQMADAPKPQAPVDLAPIRQRIDDVAKSFEAIDPIAKQFQSLSSQLDGLESSVKGLKGEIGTLQAKEKDAEPEKTASLPASSVPTSIPAQATPAAAPTTTTPTESLTLEPAQPSQEKEPAAVPLENQTFAQGIELLNGGKFDDAYKFFEKLGTTNPNDARVWYFAALGYGWAHDDFKPGSKTLSLLQKGLEREKAGTPASSEVEKAFKELSSDSGKLWLTFKREEQGLK